MDIGIRKRSLLSSILENRKHALFCLGGSWEYLTSNISFSSSFFAGNNQHCLAKAAPES
jgi:hypothetical protein